MDDLILYDDMLKKKGIIKNFIEYDCSAGRKAYSDNDFVLKTVFDYDKLLNLGEWVGYGDTDYGGIIRRRTIDTQSQIVIYEGSTYRGVMNYIMMQEVNFDSYAGTDYKAVGSMSEIFNDMLSESATPAYYTQNKIYATSQISTEFEVSVLTTNGVGIASYLSEHDNIIRQCSTGSTPKKSKWSIKNGKINVDFMESNIIYVDQTHAFIKFIESIANPNLSYLCVKNDMQDYGVGAYDDAYLDENKNVVWGSEHLGDDWIVDSDHPLNCISIYTATDDGLIVGKPPQDAIDILVDAQDKPSVELTVDIETAEIDDVIVASIAEFGMKVTKKVVESTLHISNGIPKITYTLEG